MKRMLVALDGSPLATHVLEEAIAIAKACGARIRLVRAVPIPTVAPVVPVPGVTLPITQIDLEAIAAAATLSLREAAKKIPPGLRGGVSLDVGAPWRVVLAAAKHYEADLIVLGAHAHGPLRRLLGTTAVRVVERASVPVLIVRPPPGRAPLHARGTDDAAPPGPGGIG